jgi:predicted AAA+ superfamily ATPase
VYREAINQLKKWKLNKNKKPLVFLGTRQVGKTWLIKDIQ